MKLNLLCSILDYFCFLSLTFILFGAFLEPLLRNKPSHRKDPRHELQQRPERDGEPQVVAGLHESTFALSHSAGAQTQVVSAAVSAVGISKAPWSRSTVCSLAANDAQPSADSEDRQGKRPLSWASAPPV